MFEKLHEFLFRLYPFNHGYLLNETIQHEDQVLYSQSTSRKGNHSPAKGKYLLLYSGLISLRKQHGEKVIAQVKVDDAVLGMRGLPLILYDGSSLDPISGITFRGESIP